MNYTEMMSEVQRRRTKFIPSRYHYDHWVFEYCCRYLEDNHINPAKSYKFLNEMMRGFGKETLRLVNEEYETTDTHFIYILAPKMDCIDEVLKNDDSTKGLRLCQLNDKVN